MCIYIRVIRVIRVTITICRLNNGGHRGQVPDMRRFLILIQNVTVFQYSCHAINESHAGAKLALNLRCSTISICQALWCMQRIKFQFQQPAIYNSKTKWRNYNNRKDLLSNSCSKYCGGNTPNKEPLGWKAFFLTVMTEMPQTLTKVRGWEEKLISPSPSDVQGLFYLLSWWHHPYRNTWRVSLPHSLGPPWCQRNE